MNEPQPGWTAHEVLTQLATLGSPEKRAGMARFGIATDRAFGLSNDELRRLGRRIGRHHERAEALWRSGWREARLLAAYTEEPKLVTCAQAKRWADDFASWEIVDGVADLFGEAGLAHELVPVFAADDREFVRRAAFSMIAWCAIHLKKETDATFLEWLPLIESHATDPRNYVRKGVSWALRQIGKRSLALHGPALTLAEKLAAAPDRAARWIGNDAARELKNEKQLARLASRGA